MHHSYQKPRQLASNLWELRGEWSNKFGRRMTVIRLHDGRIAVHNSFQLQAEDLNWLKSLGNVSHIIGPNLFHCSDAGWMAQQFSDAKIYVPTKKFKPLVEMGFSPLDVNTQFPHDIASELRCIPMQGSRVYEAAFLHIPSHTLILCDLAFNMEDVFTGFEKKFMTWNRVGVRFGPTKLTRYLFCKNKKALIASYKNLLALDFDRVIVNHGAVLEKDGKNLLKKSVEEIFGSF